MNGLKIESETGQACITALKARIDEQNKRILALKNQSLVAPPLEGRDSLLETRTTKLVPSISLCLHLYPPTVMQFAGMQFAECRSSKKIIEVGAAGADADKTKATGRCGRVAQRSHCTSYFSVFLLRNAMQL